MSKETDIKEYHDKSEWGSHARYLTELLHKYYIQRFALATGKTGYIGLATNHIPVIHMNQERKTPEEFPRLFDVDYIIPKGIDRKKKRRKRKRARHLQIPHF